MILRFVYFINFSGPLAGYKILDMTRVLAGPFASMILGDLGATVIKVIHLRQDYTTADNSPKKEKFEKKLNLY